MQVRSVSLAALSGAGVVCVALAGVLAGTATRVLLGERAAIRAQLGQADVILVFGGRAVDGWPTREVRARLDQAVRLWRAGVAPVVAVSGGGTGAADEPAAMARYLQSQEIPAQAVVACVPGENTRVSLASARTQFGPVSIVAASSAYHGARIRAEARRTGMNVAVSAPEGSPDLLNPRVHRVRLGTEILGLIWYALPPKVAAATHPGAARHWLAAAMAGESR